ncbi:hypothetical protein EV356DRAFT_504056 [Viridothelium virens]|uniref:Nuclear pore assembly and biogenesis-domain-containing protein n=1 Tax=Viridothelium virens TaxID=1048519 RepID=A0A6A6H661_VIRVR|nr:hypothetical protein EV356DRAFT_504056 [Viridothelium virens]
MDFVQDWANYLHYLTSSPLSPLSTYSSYLQSLTSFSTRLSAFFSPFLNKLTTSPDLASIALLLLTLIASLVILDMLWRAVIYWVRLFFNLVFWASAVGLGFWMWNRGPDGVIEDIEMLIGVWSKEYTHWKQRAEMSEAWRKQQYGGTYGGNHGGANRRGRGTKMSQWR